MLLKDSVEIRAVPEKVWSFIEDPARMQLWNPKVQNVSPISWGEPSLGFRYRITYAMSGKARQLSAEIVEHRKPQRLVIRLVDENWPRGSTVREIYELSATPQGTLLEQRIEIDNSGVNIFWRVLIAFIMRFGKPVGQKYLEKLKELVEAEDRLGD